MNNNSKNNRIMYVDIMKCIAIVLVIVGHINQYNATFKSYIYSYHMPLFFFIYGIIIANKTSSKKKLKEFIFTRFIALMIPYFVWALIYADVSITNIVKIIYGSYTTISESGALSSLWFLPCMFISDIIFKIIIDIMDNYKKKKMYLFVVVFLLVIILLVTTFVVKINIGYPWCFNVAICATIFMIIGFIFEKYIKKFLVGVSAYKYISLVIFFIISLIYILNVSNDCEYVLMANGRYGNLLLFFISSCASCGFIMLLSMIFEKIIPINIKKFLSFVGQNTLTIFVIHKPIISILESIFKNKIYYSFINLIIITIITLTVCCIISKIINKCIPQIVGKK